MRRRGDDEPRVRASGVGATGDAPAGRLYEGNRALGSPAPVHRLDSDGRPPMMTVLLGLYTVNFLTGVMTIFAAVGAIAREIEEGTLHAIVPKPLARWEIIAGKYLGFLAMIVIYLALMVSGVVLTAYSVGDYTP